MPGLPMDSTSIGRLAHETFHAVVNAGTRLGFKPTDESDEFYAYLQEWLVRSILERVAKVKPSPA
jgi:phosphate starvation-inducible protein PhoH